MKANSLINDDLKIKTKEKFDQESEECVIGPFNVLSIWIFLIISAGFSQSSVTIL